MIYGSLQAEFMATKYSSHIHAYGTSVLAKIVVNISKSINHNNNNIHIYHNKRANYLREIERKQIKTN